MAIAPRSRDSARLLADQYRDSSNLSARQALHARFSREPHGWHDWVFDRLALNPDARILEAGCGPGALWQSVAGRMPAGWSVTLCDFSPGMIEAARRSLADARRGFRFKVADIQALPFEDGSFDAVIANHMLYHVPDIDRGLREVRRMLVEGGRVFAATNGEEHMREMRDLVRAVAPAWAYSKEGDPCRAFSLENGREILERHFADVRLHVFEGGLEITEVEPVVAYVRSVEDARDFFGDAEAEKLRALVAAEIKHTGAVRVQRSTGMFEGAKA